MAEGNKRTTVYLEPHIHKLLKLKAAEDDCTISDLVNESIRLRFKEDAIDLAAVRDRAKEPSRSFEEFVEEMSKSGLL